MEAVGANLPGPQALQELASEVEERPRLHVVQSALYRAENLLAPHLVPTVEAVCRKLAMSAASQEAASEDEGRPTMHVVKSALAHA